MESPLWNINLCIEIRHNSCATIEVLNHPDNLEALKRVWYRAQCMLRCLHVVFVSHPPHLLALQSALLLIASCQTSIDLRSNLNRAVTDVSLAITILDRHASSAAQISIKTERLLKVLDYMTLDDENWFCLADRETLCNVQPIKRGTGWRNSLLVRAKYMWSSCIICSKNVHQIWINRQEFRQIMLNRQHSWH